MKKVVLVMALLFVGIGILTARPSSDIGQIEGLDYSYNEFEEFIRIFTYNFYLIEGNET